MQQHIASEYLWPRRVVAPAFREGTLNETVLLEAQLEELTRDDPLLRAFAARDPNAPTTALRRAVDEADIPSDAPAFNINLGVLGPELMSAVTDFQEFNWTQQLQAADAAAAAQSAASKRRPERRPTCRRRPTRPRRRQRALRSIPRR